MHRLDRSRTALIVIDPQSRLLAAIPDAERVVARTRLLVRVAAIVGMPVVFTRQNPAGLGEFDERIVEALEAARPSVTVEGADKMAFDCFSDEAFVGAVRRTGADTLLITGVETHICVCQTALSALFQEFAVHVAADACATREPAMHDLAILRLAHAGATVTTAESAAYELVGLAGTDEFRALLAAVKG